MHASPLFHLKIYNEVKMDSTFLLTISLFALVMSATPGPNNMMLLASGAQFGYRRTLPHIFGVVLGIALLLSSVLVGLGMLFSLYPLLYKVLNLLGSTYLLYLAWKITTAATDDSAFAQQNESNNNSPMSIFSAVLFQFINPKAWAMTIGSVSTFTLVGEQYVASGLCIMGAFAIVGFFSISLWVCLGVAIHQLLTTRIRKRNFNWLMGAMTVSTLLLMLAD